MSKEKFSDDMFDQWSPDEIYSPEALKELAHSRSVHKAMQDANEVSKSLCREHGVSSIAELPVEVQHRVTEEAAVVNQIVSLGYRHE